ncbi:MAG: Rossmann-like and DUF2520 domain-containing protein [Bacteroidota bacterium]
MKIEIVGAGNVGFNLGVHLKNSGHTITRVISRSQKSAACLAGMTDSEWSTGLNGVGRNCDLVILSVNDDALPEVVKGIGNQDCIVVHTSGSMNMEPLMAFTHYGVFYPVQTFTRNHIVGFEGIPVCIEANERNTELILTGLAQSIKAAAYMVDSEQRAWLHIAAVFACNFTTHLYGIAEKILEKNDMSRDLIMKLIAETAAKYGNMPVSEAQTGPAKRNDRNILKKHMDLLSSTPELHDLYRLFSERINLVYNKKCNGKF